MLQTCPLLLRVFTTNSGRHHRVDEFARGNVPSSELQIYTWLVPGFVCLWNSESAAFDSPSSQPSRMDATLKELTSLVKEVYPEARKKGTHFSFSIVYPDPRGKVYRFVYDKCDRQNVCEMCIWIQMCVSLFLRLKDIGSTVSGRKGTEDSLTLQSQRFQIGDYLDIAITPPNRAPPLSTRMRPF